MQGHLNNGRLFFVGLNDKGLFLKDIFHRGHLRKRTFSKGHSGQVPNIESVVMFSILLLNTDLIFTKCFTTG